MDQPNNKLIFFNRIFITTCSFWASVHKELNISRSVYVAFIDLTTIIWSFAILFTSFYKLVGSNHPLNHDKKKASLPSVGAGLGLGELKQLITLDYLPNIDQFSTLYYGLMLVTIGSALVWRLYLNFYRHSNCYLKRHPTYSSDGNLLFDAKLELAEFFLSGPMDSNNKALQINYARLQDDPSMLDEMIRQRNEQHKGQREESLLPHFIQPLNKRKRIHAIKSMEQLIIARHYAESLAARFHKPALFPPELPKQERLLARLHLTRDNLYPNSKGSPLSSDHKLAQDPQCSGEARLRGGSIGGDMFEASSDGGHMDLKQVYQVPIRAVDFLYDKSANRWNYLAGHLYKLVTITTILSIPLFYYIIVGLNSVRYKFRGPQQGKIGVIFDLYGPLEQTYACLQASLFFIATNVFITLFHIDLIYKARPITREIMIISNMYRMEQLNRLPQSEVYRQQLRIWAYFDNISQLDDFMSKYSLISMATIVIGLSFGQSFIRLEDVALKLGSGAAIVSNLFSFTYLHLVSWHIEKQTTPVHKAILSIIARETSYNSKRQWQRTLFGFFVHDSHRTFTLDGRYPLNLQSFLKTIFGLATMSLVINRLFHKRVWGTSFANQVLEQQVKATR